MWTDAHATGFAQRLAVLAEILAEPVSPVRIAGYRAALDDLPPDEVYAAIGQAAKSCIYFPKPVEIRTIVDEARDRAMLAARRLDEQAREQARLTDERKQLTTRLDVARDKPVSQEAVDECRAALRAIIQRATMPGCVPRDGR